MTFAIREILAHFVVLKETFYFLIVPNIYLLYDISGSRDNSPTSEALATTVVTLSGKPFVENLLRLRKFTMLITIEEMLVRTVRLPMQN